MPEWQRRACRRAFAAGAVASLLLIVIVAINLRAITTSSYRMTITAIAQATTREAAIREGAEPAQVIARIIASAGGDANEEASVRLADRSTLYVQSFTLRSTDATALSRIASAIARRSPWRVTNVSSSGEFVAVKRGTAILWVLRSRLAASQKPNQVSIELSGPNVTIGYEDYLALLLLAALVISFGSLERNNRDPAAFPRGLHPFVVFWQALLAGMLVCWTLICLASHAAVLFVFLGLACLCVFSLARWALTAQIGAVLG